MSETKPEPYAGPVLFHVWYHAGTQRAGAPLDLNIGSTSERLAIVAAPGQLMRLLDELSKPAIKALLTIIQHAYTPGQRVEIPGSLIEWLKAHGMRPYEAREGAAELGLKKFIRREDIPDSRPPRQQVILQSGVIETVDDPVGQVRKDGRRISRPRSWTVSETGGEAPAESPESEVIRMPSNDQNPVDNPVNRVPDNDRSPQVGLPNVGQQFPKVSPTFRPSDNTFSTGSTSSSFREVRSHYFFDSTSVRRALPRHDYTTFLTQPAIVDALDGSSWEIVVAELAKCFLPRTTRCREILDWLGQPPSKDPSTALAIWIRDLLSARGMDRIEVVAELDEFLASFPVHHAPIPPDEFLTAMVVTTVCSLDSKRPIGSYAGWFHTFLERDTWNVSVTMKNVLQRLTQTIADDENDTPVTGPAPTVELDVPVALTPAPAEPTTHETTPSDTDDEPENNGVTVASSHDTDWLVQLSQAIEGTEHDTPEGFDALLNDRKAAAYLIAKHMSRQARESRQVARADRTA